MTKKTPVGVVLSWVGTHPDASLHDARERECRNTAVQVWSLSHSRSPLQKKTMPKTLTARRSGWRHVSPPGVYLDESRSRHPLRGRLPGLWSLHRLCCVSSIDVKSEHKNQMHTLEGWIQHAYALCFLLEDHNNNNRGSRSTLVNWIHLLSDPAGPSCDVDRLVVARTSRD